MNNESALVVFSGGQDLPFLGKEAFQESICP